MSAFGNFWNFLSYEELAVPELKKIVKFKYK